MFISKGSVFHLEEEFDAAKKRKVLGKTLVNLLVVGKILVVIVDFLLEDWVLVFKCQLLKNH